MATPVSAKWMWEERGWLEFVAHTPERDLRGHRIALTYHGLAIDLLTWIYDIDDFEFAHDPDHQGKDSDPYSVFAVSNHRQLVADAAGNSLLLVRDGKVRVVAVFPNNRFGSQSVPTSITRGPDGAFYVGELGGDGTPAGGSRVWRVVPGQRPTVFRGGFSAITDVAFGRAFVTWRANVCGTSRSRLPQTNSAGRSSDGRRSQNPWSP